MHGYVLLMQTPAVRLTQQVQAQEPGQLQQAQHPGPQQQAPLGPQAAEQAWPSWPDGAGWGLQTDG